MYDASDVENYSGHYLRQRQLNFLLCGQAKKIISGWLIGKMIIILSFRVGKIKMKNIDHQVKETCAILSTQVTHEIDHIFVLID